VVVLHVDARAGDSAGTLSSPPGCDTQDRERFQRISIRFTQRGEQMMDRSALLVFSLLLPALVHGGEIYRWTDDKGQIHYGDKVPGAFQGAAKPVEVNGAAVSDEERQAAQARLAREKKQLQENADSGRTATPQAAPPPAPREAATCEEQWARYDASWACFNPYRTAYGAVKAEAYQHCTQIEAPACTRESK